jgi:hypothetical protein
MARQQRLRDWENRGAGLLTKEERYWACHQQEREDFKAHDAFYLEESKAIHFKGRLALLEHLRKKANEAATAAEIVGK